MSEFADGKGAELQQNHRPVQEQAAPEGQAPAGRAPGGVQGMLAERAGSISETTFRFSGGAAGTPPMARVEAARRNTVGAAAARILRKASGSGGGGAQVPQGSGAPLGSDVKQKMESKLGADLSGVRVHTGGESAEAASGFGAKAFTVGSDVHFGSGQFSPGTKEGDRLLAHELTHVVQGQKGGIQRSADEGAGAEAKAGGGNEVSQPHEPAEKEADAVADKVADELHDGKAGAKGEAKAAAKGGAAKGAGEAKPAEAKPGAKGAGAEAKGDAHGEAKAGADSAAAPAEKDEAKAAGGEAKEKPVAAISAKLEGTAFKLWRSTGPNPAPRPPGGGPAPGPQSGPKRPQTPAEYQALPGWTEFLGNCTSIGVSAAEAMTFWKSCMDQLFVNDEAVARLGGDRKAILDYVDSAGARGGFTAMADAMLKKFPLDLNKEYALWSGKNAELFAQANGCQVLEGTQLGSLFNNVRTAFSANWSVMQGLWRAISDAYARKIAGIMKGKKIKVFVRKEGDIFKEVESKAIQEISELTQAKPEYEFHPIGCVGTFSKEAKYDGTPNNADAREELKTAAGGDVAKATSKSQAKGLKIFDWAGGPVPVGSLTDLGATGSLGGAMGKLAPMDAATATKVDEVKRELSKKGP